MVNNDIKIQEWAQVGQAVYLETRESYSRWSGTGTLMRSGQVIRTTKTQVIVEFKSGDKGPVQRRFQANRWNDKLREIGSSDWDEKFLVSEEIGAKHNERVRTRTALQKVKDDLLLAVANFESTRHGWRPDVDAARDIIVKAQAVVDMYGETFDREKADADAQRAKWEARKL